jgi:arginase family enzyme
MSRLRAKCPSCGTFTAVALGPDYECHACGRGFGAGLVRVPRAWGQGGEAMVEASALPFPYPETAVVAEDTLGEQTLALAADLPERPFVLGGCCCSHVGAIQALDSRHGKISVVWFDAHGDLNTPETSPSGNAWGMPLRTLIDAAIVEPQDVVLVGARNLDAPEEEYIVRTGLRVGAAAIAEAVDGTAGVYVALDADVLDPNEVSVFMPEPGGLSVAEVGRLFAELRAMTSVLGLGLTGLAPSAANVPSLTPLWPALGL